MRIDIGLTGNIASGKSLVSSMLRELGAAVLDADLIGKSVLARNVGGALDQVRTAFGSGVFRGSQLDRRALGNLVFNSPDLLFKLNSIMVPVMTELIIKEMECLHRTSDAVVLDAAILIEAGWQSLVDEVWVVRASKAEQLERLMTRDHLSRDEAVSRIAAQMPLDQKLPFADVIIDNTQDVEKTRKQVESLWQTHLQNR
ncbi:MAG: dephospho-CoA kinase [Candidatus Cryosericum sp.]|nr:dephospho-CoA kinase [bacterium]